MSSPAESNHRPDNVFRSFLLSQEREGLELARSSDLLDLEPLDGPAARHYRAIFHCNGLVRIDGRVGIANRFEIGIWFPPDYLDRADPFQVLTWLGPVQTWHPNISDRAPFLCIGPMRGGERLEDILYRVYEVVTYQRVTMTEKDALNWAACQWARGNQERFPIDRRPLKRRVLPIRTESTGPAPASDAGGW